MKKSSALITPLNKKELQNFLNSQPEGLKNRSGRLSYDYFKTGLEILGFEKLCEQENYYNDRDAVSAIKEKEERRLSVTKNNYSLWEHPCGILLKASSYGNEISSVQWVTQMDGGFDYDAYTDLNKAHIGTINVKSPLTGNRVMDIDGVQNQYSHFEHVNNLLAQIKKRQNPLPYSKWEDAGLYLDANYYTKIQVKPEWEDMSEDDILKQMNLQKEEQKLLFISKMNKRNPELGRFLEISLLDESKKEYLLSTRIKSGKLSAIEHLQHYFLESKLEKLSPKTEKTLKSWIEWAIKNENLKTHFPSFSQDPLIKGLTFSHVLFAFAPQRLPEWLNQISVEARLRLFMMPDGRGMTFPLYIMDGLLQEHHPSFPNFSFSTQEEKNLNQKSLFFSEILKIGEQTLGQENMIQTFSTQKWSAVGLIVKSLMGNDSEYRREDLAFSVSAVLNNLNDFYGQGNFFPIDAKWTEKVIPRKEDKQKKTTFPKFKLDFEKWSQLSTFQDLKNIPEFESIHEKLESFDLKFYLKQVTQNSTSMKKNKNRI